LAPPERRRNERAGDLLQAEPLDQQVDRQRVRVQGRQMREHLAGPDPRPGATGLRHDTDAREEPGTVADGVEAERADRPALRAAHADACLERRRLPGAVRSQHRGDRPGLDLEAETVGRERVAIAHGQLVDAQS